jgi:hypothetical protein
LSASSENVCCSLLERGEVTLLLLLVLAFLFPAVEKEVRAASSELIRARLLRWRCWKRERNAKDGAWTSKATSQRSRTASIPVMTVVVVAVEASIGRSAWENDDHDQGEE